MKAGVIPARTPAERALMEHYRGAKPRLPGGRNISGWRDCCFRAFESAGLPHRRIESWHYTDLRALMRERLPLANPPAGEAIEKLNRQLAGPMAAKRRIVLADGYFVPELSSPLPEGVRVRSLAAALAEDRPGLIPLLSCGGLGEEDPVLALNAAMMQSGALIEVGPGVAVNEPIHLVYAAAAPSPVSYFSRSVLTVGNGACVRLAEWGLSTGGPASSPRQANAVLAIDVGEGASLFHSAKAGGAASGSIQLDTLLARIGAGARFETFSFVSGAAALRRQMFIRLEGADSEASIKGVSLLRGREHADVTLRLEHAGARCRSREIFKYIADEQATGVFQGKIRVLPEAQKTDAKMLAKAVLLSESAAMNSKPELEIFADDVVCGHGATSGSLDKDQLFYLQSRGLRFDEAEALLLEAFAADVIDSIGYEEVAKRFRNAVRAWLSARRRTELEAEPATA